MLISGTVQPLSILKLWYSISGQPGYGTSTDYHSDSLPDPFYIYILLYIISNLHASCDSTVLLYITFIMYSFQGCT